MDMSNHLEYVPIRGLSREGNTAPLLFYDMNPGGFERGIDAVSSLQIHFFC
jgi:hypothetical protein